MHQPIEPPIDETSTSADATGGTLTSQPLTKFLFEQGVQVMNIDQRTDMPFLHRRLVMDNTTAFNTNLLNYDPFVELFTPVSRTSAIPYARLALQSCYLYDFDLKLTFFIVKHERARGILMLTWAPGVLPGNDVDVTNTKLQKWTWDIEKDEVCEIVLKGTKLTPWRSRMNMDTGAAYPNLWTNIIVQPLAYDTYHGGTLNLIQVMSYNGANVAPPAADIMVFGQLLNLKTAEYRPPFATRQFEQPYSLQI